MPIPAINTPKSIIETALRHAGKLSEGQMPSSEQYTQHLNDLNRMVNLWQTDGLRLWLQEDLEIPLITGKGGHGNPYQLGVGGDVNMTRPTRVLQGYYLDPFDVRRPLYPLSRDEWMRLSLTTQQGQLSQYFVDKRQYSMDVYTWLVPDATASQGTLHLLIQQQVENSVMLTDTVNFPVEWSLALVWGLADELSTGQPQAIMDRCLQRAAMYKTKLDDWDVEDAVTSFAPDQRWTEGSNFR